MINLSPLPRSPAYFCRVVNPYSTVLSTIYRTTELYRANTVQYHVGNFSEYNIMSVEGVPSKQVALEGVCVRRG